MPTISVTASTTEAAAKTDHGLLEAASSLLRGRFGVEPATISGVVHVNWPASSGSKDDVITPVRLSLKLVVYEQISIDRGHGLQLKNALLYREGVVWPPEQVRAGSLSTNNEDGDGGEDEDEETILQGLSASPAVQKAIQARELTVPFTLPLPEDLPATTRLPYGRIRYKLSLTFAYQRGSGLDVPVEIEKYRKEINVPRWHSPSDTDTNVPANISNDGSNGRLGGLAYTVTIPQTHIVPGQSIEATLRPADGSSDLHGAGLRNVQLYLYLLDTYHHESYGETSYSKVIAETNVPVTAGSKEIPITLTCPKEVVVTTKTPCIQADYVLSIKLQTAKGDTADHTVPIVIKSTAVSGKSG